VFNWSVTQVWIELGAIVQQMEWKGLDTETLAA
jgi:hypothetical protein